MARTAPVDDPLIMFVTLVVSLVGFVATAGYIILAYGSEASAEG